MREILFRGKDEYGVWHYGLPMAYSGDFVVITAPHMFDKTVIPETVGQYTGLIDKNGTKVFEGDIIRRALHMGKFDYVVIYNCRRASFELKSIKHNGYLDMTYVAESKVIGSIYDAKASK